MSRDHPRACGEHKRCRRLCAPYPGSSPRLRGTPTTRNSSLAETGIIPALAGNTRCGPVRGPAPWDHPRACGEHAIPLLAGSICLGSSPRLRGTQYFNMPPRCTEGIIPALAGNTLLFSYGGGVWRDHPRACGEHFTSPLNKYGSEGSSPRLRGTRARRIRIRSDAGIIPALAGNTNGLTTQLVLLRDHPRACGEHLPRSMSAIRLTGSSPRLRGTLTLPAIGPHEDGIIPALAGNTTRSTRRTRPPRDHPRACGEHLQCVGCRLA